MKHYLLLLVLFSVSFTTTAQQLPAVENGLNSITHESVSAQLEFLASDWMEGRETGEKGCFMAADYIASMFKLYGLKPAGDLEIPQLSMQDRIKGARPQPYQTYFQNINFIETDISDEQFLTIISGSSRIKLNNKTDFGIGDVKTSIENQAGVVFAGYGFNKDGYNDFEDVDVKGKYVIWLAGYPGYNDTLSEGYKKFKPADQREEYQRYRNKMEYIYTSGALGVLEVRPGDDILNRWTANYPFRFNSDIYEGDVELRGSGKRFSLMEDTLNSGFAHIYITARTANELLRGSGLTVKQFEIETAADPEPRSFEIKNKQVHLNLNVSSRIIRSQNVVGYIEGEDPSKVIVVGGHYDHVGRSGGYIYNGADDNASGTVGVMTIAKAAAAAGVKPKYSILFAAWTGEEKGLLGSTYFVKNNPIKNSEIIANLNYDMISRDSFDDSLGVKCSMTYTKAYKQLEDITSGFNSKYKLGLDIRFRASDKPSGGSDHAPFAAVDIPIFYFMAGFHPDYHQPADHVSKVNIRKMTDIIKIGYLNVWTIANTPGFFTEQLSAN